MVLLLVVLLRLLVLLRVVAVENLNLNRTFRISSSTVSKDLATSARNTRTEEPVTPAMDSSRYTDVEYRASMEVNPFHRFPRRPPIWGPMVKEAHQCPESVDDRDRRQRFLS